MAIPRQMRCLRHVSDGVWELKTLEVRMFGWFYRRDVFICAAVQSADAVKKDQLYDFYREKVVTLRDELALDGAKFLPGGNPDDVISDSD